MRTPTPSEKEYIARLHRVLDHVNTHLDGDLSLTALARVACFSPFHFHRIFSVLLGETPPDYVRRLRLERAAILLRQFPDRPVTSIALACGFSSSAVFARAFRERFDTSPTAWRTSPGHIRKNRKAASKNRKAKPARGEYLVSAADRVHHKRGERDPMDITIKELPPRHIAFVADLEGYTSPAIKAAWDRLCGWAGPQGLLGPQAEMIGISFDDPKITPKNKCRYYACVTIPAGIVPPRDIGVMDIPAGRHAVISFEGPEDSIAAAYNRLYAEWLPSSGYQPADHPCYEIYHNNPEEDPEGHFDMEICLPIEPLRD